MLLEEKFYCHIQFWMNQVCVKLLHARIRCTEINKKVINLIIPLNLKIYNQEIAHNEILIVTRATLFIYYTRETLRYEWKKCFGNTR